MNDFLGALASLLPLMGFIPGVSARTLLEELLTIGKRKGKACIISYIYCIFTGDNGAVIPFRKMINTFLYLQLLASFNIGDNK